MTRRTFVAATTASCLAPIAAVSAPDLAQAQALFTSGDWDAAAKAFEGLLRADPSDPEVAVGLARLRLAENALAEASRLAALAPADPVATRVSSAAASRRTLLDASVEGPARVSVPFLAVDPLPVVEVRVNGRRARFYVDTGGGDPILDPTFAQELSLKVSTAGMGTFAGGKQASVGSARVETFALGEAMMRQVDVQVVPTRAIPIFHPPADGVVGTRTLLRFLATIDYQNGRLVLRRRRLEQPTGAAVRMWWYGDHFLMARGRVADAPEALYFIDTGLAGGGLMPSEATIKAAHLDVSAPAGTGVNGAAQAVRVIPFTAPSVTLGSVTRTDVPGLWSPDGSVLKIFPFACAGLISHSFFRPGSLTFDVDDMRLFIT